MRAPVSMWNGLRSDSKNQDPIWGQPQTKNCRLPIPKQMYKNCIFRTKKKPARSKTRNQKKYFSSWAGFMMRIRRIRNINGTVKVGLKPQCAGSETFWFRPWSYRYSFFLIRSWIQIQTLLSFNVKFWVNVQINTCRLKFCSEDQVVVVYVCKLLNCTGMHLNFRQLHF